MAIATNADQTLWRLVPADPALEDATEAQWKEYVKTGSEAGLSLKGRPRRYGFRTLNLTERTAVYDRLAGGQAFPAWLTAVRIGLVAVDVPDGTEPDGYVRQDVAGKARPAGDVMLVPEADIEDAFPWGGKDQQMSIASLGIAVCRASGLIDLEGNG